MPFLITYACESGARRSLGMDIVECPLQWLESCEQYTEEVYYLVNVLPVTQEQAEKYDGAFKGM